MATITWDTVGERYFETGVDHGVLFIDSLGIPWSGITAVNESSSGGDAQPFYLDGVKYANISAAEEYTASIEAYASPPQFAKCDGALSVANGLFVTQQPRAPFSFSYRTRKGNDLLGSDYGYKIHIVYNALAAPSGRNYGTLNETPGAEAVSWSITTTPPRMTGYKPTAHLVIDSALTPAPIMARLQAILYGTSTTNSRLPSFEELVLMFANFDQLEVTQEQADGSFAIEDYEYIVSPTRPLVAPGETALWLDTSGNGPNTLNYITGE